MKILITGTTGDSMPPPYAGIPNVSLLYGRTWKEMGNDVFITFVYEPNNSDDLGANAKYFFEYKNKPNKIKKLGFLVKYFIKNPFLYLRLLLNYYKVYPRLTAEIILYASYGVFMDGVIENCKPDIILSQAALIKTFMISEVAKIKKIPVVYNTYAEVHDQLMGVNKHLNTSQQKIYWTYFLNMASMVIGMDNCSVGPLMYLPSERVKVFYDTCDFSIYQKEIKESKEELREYFNLPKDIFLVGMTGAFHYRKGHDQLIKSISILKKQGVNNIGACIVGGNVGMEKWQELAKNEDVLDRIFFFQNFGEDKKTKLYKTIDCYANLSNSTRSCGLDLALLEAMACALPIIVYDNGALPNAISKDSEYSNGILVKTADLVALSKAILNMSLKNKDERVLMAEKSREIASKTDVKLTAKIKFDWFVEIINNYKK